MSKIFEALKKTEGEMAEVVLPIVTGPEAPEASAAAEPLPESKAEPDSLEELRAFLPEQAPEPGQRPALGFRTVAIRLSVDAPILPFNKPHSRAGEQYRMARTRIIHHPASPRLLVVSSPGPGDGKTITSVNLAGALALKSNAQVLLVDADMRHSTIASVLGVETAPGLADVLAGTCELENAILRIEQFPSLCFLPAGTTKMNPSELLDSPGWSEACRKFRQWFGYVVFDTPPVAAVADFDLIQDVCDGVVLVMRQDHSNRSLCLKTLDAVPKEKLIGVVMNCVTDWFLAQTDSYYYYQYPAAV